SGTPRRSCGASSAWAKAPPRAACCAPTSSGSPQLPWKDEAQKPIDIAEARKVLDQDHFGLEKIKRRILEHLAVRKLNPTGKSPILCFVGTPRVGQTSLGQSIAKATNRKFVRVSLGGVHDEAEIRGHRRTYIGS